MMRFTLQASEKVVILFSSLTDSWASLKGSTMTGGYTRLFVGSLL